MTKADPVRDTSKLLFGNRLRLEVAAAIAGDPTGVCHAAALATRMGVNNNQVAAELKNLENAGLLTRKPTTPGTRRVEYQRLQHPFWELSAEVLRHTASTAQRKQVEGASSPAVCAETDATPTPTPTLGDIRVDTDQLGLLAERLGENAETIATVRALLDGQVAPIQSGWHGVAAAAFAEVWAEWQHSSGAVLDELRELAVRTQQAAVHYSETAAAIAECFARGGDEPAERDCPSLTIENARASIHETEARILAPARSAGYDLRTIGTTSLPKGAAVMIEGPGDAWLLLRDWHVSGASLSEGGIPLIPPEARSKIVALTEAGVRPDVVWLAHALPQSRAMVSAPDLPADTMVRRLGSDAARETDATSVASMMSTATLDRLSRGGAPRVVLGGVVDDGNRYVEWVILAAWIDT